MIVNHAAEHDLSSADIKRLWLHQANINMNTLIAKRWQRAYRDLLPREFLDGLDIVERESVWSNAIANDDIDVLVAESAHQIAGFCALGRSRDNDAERTILEIHALYLDSSYWSRGLGHRLWLATHRILNRENADAVYLWVLADNIRAIHFYEAAGFKPVTRSEKTIKIGDVELQEVKYARRIGNLEKGTHS